jgi:hypothetical protein
MTTCSSCGGRLLPKATNCPHCNKFIEGSQTKSAASSFELNISHFIILGVVLTFCIVSQLFFSAGSMFFKAKDGLNSALESSDVTMTMCVGKDNSEIPVALSNGAIEVASDDPTMRCFQSNSTASPE